MTAISVVIPTYNRGEIVIQAINELAKQSVTPKQIIVVDQTVYTDSQDAIAVQLQQFHNAGTIHWLRLNFPSIPNAMNEGLLFANSEFVLFLDDDSQCDSKIIEHYQSAIEQFDIVAAVGQVLQPGEQPIRLPEHYQAGTGINQDLQFPFNADRPARIADCIACNFLVHRQSAIECGGFDLQFEAVAYRFETEFCRRLVRNSGELLHFLPAARVNHLKASSGGTRASVANFLTSSSPVHSQGDYYFAFREAQGWERWRYVAARLLGSCFAKFYLHKPWWMPVRLVGEFRGLLSALAKYRQGARLLE